MLILSRRAGETILIGDDIRVTVSAIQGGQVRVGIDAPAEVRIVRGELADADSQPKPINGDDDGVVEDPDH
ncbi:carbon storage regulator [Sediminicurvatus halobius]|uniref:Translational regulator CsrA n=1 Tax=Sediminicurvatus halobius TaxID=2182432 RepID=A0A2U2MVW3_9GAMM|nr:carbon storage regulator [Spiribacter halobius]PWG60984.1 carbon storage regulator [Spiribacter halobius]UEX77726.1 carbon storage regulator [Spiribacter halobius]